MNDYPEDNTIVEEMIDEINRLNKALEFACEQLSKTEEYRNMTAKEVSDSILKEVAPIIIG